MGSKLQSALCRSSHVVNCWMVFSRPIYACMGQGMSQPLNLSLYREGCALGQIVYFRWLGLLMQLKDFRPSCLAKQK